MTRQIPDDVLAGWLDWLEGNEPAQLRDSDIPRATKIRSFRNVGTSGGIVIRLQDIDGNETDIALNAICAVDLAKSIFRMGSMIGWDDDRLNTLIAPRHKTNA